MGIVQRLQRDKTTRNKLLYTTMIMFLLLIGYHIPIPGINTDYLKIFSTTMLESGIGGFINTLTGNSFSQMSIFALSVAPYITASIIVQLLTVIVPALERTAKDGAVGHQKIERLNLVVSIIVAFIQALGMSLTLGKKGLFNTYTWYMVVYASLLWTAGAGFLVWVGQTISKKLIGNGISLILAFNIMSTLPGSIGLIFNSIADGKSLPIKFLVIALMAVVIFLLFAYVVILNNAEKRIHITNSNRSGLKMAGSDENIMPLKLNAGGVMPIIFASSVMSLPAMIAQFFEIKPESAMAFIINCLNQSNWFKSDNMIYSLGSILFIVLTFAFSSFYSMISFNAKDISDSLRKSGHVVNGLRPGQPTTDYLQHQSKSMLWLGTTMLILIALIPTVISGVFAIEGLGFGGTTIIILVGVILEMKNTINAKTSSVTYKSLIKKG